MTGRTTRSGGAAISEDLQKYFDSPAFSTVISNAVVSALQLETVQATIKNAVDAAVQSAVARFSERVDALESMAEL